MIRIVDPLEYSGWDELVSAHPRASIFHSTNWVKVLRDSYGYRPVYFILENEGNISLVPVMEVKSPLTGKRGVSLPFADYCDPLVDSDETFGTIYDEILSYGKKNGWRYVLFKMTGKANGLGEPSARYYRHILTLDGSEEDVFKRFKSNTKRNIKKAEREGVEVVISRDKGAVREFYRLYCITRKLVQNLPPYPWKFISEEFRNVISEERGFVALAYHKGKCVAGGFFYNFGGNVLYRYGASDRKYLSLRPNNLVMWEAIKWSINNGYRTFCFGSTDVDNEGLRRFKMSWGAVEEEIRFYRFDCESGRLHGYSPRASDLSKKIFSKSPIPVLRAVGRLMYGHLG